MRYLVFIFLFGCSVTAQEPSKELNKDAEFEQLLNKVKQTSIDGIKVQQEADKQQKTIINETVNKIVSLKNELNEVKNKLDSIDSDTGAKYILLPISNSKKD
jgi:esterase/lipase